MKQLLLCLAISALPSLSAFAQDTPVEPATSNQVSKPVPVTDGTAKLSPENSKVEFVGVHVGAEPNPRLGGFEKFNGSVECDGESVKSMSMEFDITSLWTELGGNLTSHLKNPDFFDIEKFPKAKFVSTKIGSSDRPGYVNIVGDLTLMGATQSVSVPAKVVFTDSGLTLNSEFKLDRTKFGMANMIDRVGKEVTVRLSVGEKTAVKGAGEPSRDGAQPAGGRRRGMDPAAMFKQLDKDGDGKLSAEEMPERMKGRMEAMDTDKDGSITQEELEKAFQGMRGGRPGQGGDGG